MNSSSASVIQACPKNWGVMLNCVSLGPTVVFMAVWKLLKDTRVPTTSKTMCFCLGVMVWIGLD